MGGSSKKQVVGYRYHLGIHMAICHGPVDAVEEIRVDERTAWSGNVTSTQDISISAEGLFGGETREGGISGTVGILMGDATQGQDGYMKSKLGANVPAWRGVLSAVLKRCYIGTNPYLKPWAFRVKRIPQRTWYPSKAEINGDANPAHIVRECVTNDDWGMGYPESAIDDGNFRAVADTLYAENFGLSLIWTQQAPIEEFVQIVMDHIAGVFRLNPSTGLFEIKLIRGGYDPATLPVFDETNVISLERYERAAWGETVNEVVLQYSTADSRTTAVTVQDIGNIQMQGAVVSQSVQLPGIRSDALAQRVAMRELQARSTPVSRVRLQLNRTAWGMLPGDLFKLSWPDLGLQEVIYRVAEIDHGELARGRIVVEAVEDVFWMPSSVYSSQEPIGWVSPNNPPSPAPYRKLYEATYWDLVREIGENDAQALASDAGYMVVAAVAPSGDALQFSMLTRVGTASFDEAATGHFCPTATLASSAQQEVSSVLQLADMDDVDASLVGELAYLEDELVEVTAVDTVAGTLTVNRGMLDTVPEAHPAGARLFFSYELHGADETERLLGETVDAKVITITGLGELDESSAPVDSLTVEARQARPYPPGNLQLNGQRYPAAISGELTVSWSHRDRLQQTAGFIDQTAGDIGPESGTTYTLEIYGEAGTLLRTVTGITGTSYTYLAADEQADSGLTRLNDRLRIRLWAVRGGQDSHQVHDVTVDRPGYGYHYGNYYGGI